MGMRRTHREICQNRFSMLEKFGYVATLGVLFGQGRIASLDAVAAFPDGLLGLLFLVAFVRTGAAPGSR